MSNHLVAGRGEIGSAIASVLKADTVDLDPAKSKFEEKSYEFLHICFPFSKNFSKTVGGLKKRFKPKYLVVHSTVPIGTSDKLGALHSPVRGKHPNLEPGIRTFVKFIGGRGALKVAEEFEKFGIKTKIAKSARDTEAMKLWDTTQYGWNIILEKMIWGFCEKNKLDFDVVYTEANKSYNEGYAKLGNAQFTKYVLKHFPGPVGGHCVIENLELLKHPIGEFIGKYNAKLSGKKGKRSN